MADLQIPDNLETGFKQLIEIPNQKFSELLHLIESVKIGISLDELKKLFDNYFNNEYSELPRLIFSFGELLLKGDSDYATIASNLTAAYKKLTNEENNTHLDTLRNNLLLIFNKFDNLKLSLKALELLSENNNLFLNSRIITDIRSIFYDDLQDSPKYAVIIHNLKLEFQNDNDTKSIYLSLDLNDLNTLKKVVDKAILKEQRIKEDYKNQLTFIKINE